MKIIFLGTPEFSAVILETLIKNNFKPVLVITSSDKPVGRRQALTPPPVKILAQKYNIAVLQPEKVGDCRSEIENSAPDLILLAAYGQILPKDILEIPRHGCLNVHPSLLPKYRGASPIPYAILQGEKETGVTIIKMSEKVDQGEIIAQEKLEILSDDTTGSLIKKLAELSGELLIKTIFPWIGGKIKPVAQDQSPAPYCKRLRKEDGQIDWQKSAEFIERQVRAFDPWPTAFTFFEGKFLRILEAEVLSWENGRRPGEVFLTNDGKLAIVTGQNCLVLKKLQLEGGKPMAPEEFLRGHKETIGTILC